MKKIILQISLLSLGFALFFACEQGADYDQFREIPNEGWNKDSLLVFTVDVKDTTQFHNLYVNVRNDIKYKYSNLWLFIDIDQPGGTALIDTLEITLADPSGKWLGEGFGGVKTREVLYKSSVYFPVSGQYKIKIQQGMRENVLKGIADIGIRLEKQE